MVEEWRSPSDSEAFWWRLRSSLVAGPAAWAAAASDSSPSFAGHWKGAIAAPGQRARVRRRSARNAAGGALSGDISIPAQNAFDLALGDLTATESRLQFKIVGIPGDPSFDGTVAADGAHVEGSFKQGGADLSFKMERVEGAAASAKAALEGFDDFATKAVEAWNVPGAGIAIVSGGEVVYAKGFGWRDLEAKKPMTADTLFAIGSTTKAMTATTLGMLVDEGKVEWDQPLREYLPSFKLMDASISERITPRDIVTHRSGLPRHDLLWYNYNSGTRGDMVKRLAYLELTADLREKFQYNNLMFMTAGLPDRDAHRQELGAERARAAVRSARDEALDVLGDRLAEGRRLRAALPRARGRPRGRGPPVTRAHPVPAHRPGGAGRRGQLVGQRDGEVAALQPAPRQGGGAASSSRRRR